MLFTFYSNLCIILIVEFFMHKLFNFNFEREIFMKFKRIIALASAIAMSISALSFSAVSTVSADDIFDNLNQTEITEAMGPGWNLGNQLEASVNGIPYETAWGNPEIKQQTFHMIKNAGFKNVRIPVSYLSKIGAAPSYTIDASWLERIKTVVDMALAEGLYVIINMHGDGYNTVSGGWLLCNASSDQQSAIKEKYAACWKQIAEKFKNYDEHLIFESMNEEFDGTYATPNRTYYSNINDYNQIFVNTIRLTGGNNNKRWLLIPGWNTDIEYTTGNYGFVLPTDIYRDSSIPSDEQRIMISVHYYTPWDFCGDGSWSKTTWGTDSEIQTLQELFTKCYASFVIKGYPVVIGEYGSVNKYNENSRITFAREVCKAARSRGMIPVIWDNNGNGIGADSFGLFERSTYQVTQQGIINAIMSAFSGNPDPAPDIMTKNNALAVIYSTKNATTLASGTADASMAGAVKVRCVFDCASDVSFNPYTYLNLSSTIAGTNSQTSAKGNSYETGVTKLTAVLSLTNSIKQGDSYSFSAYTVSWANASDYVFLIRCLEFLDSNGNVIKTIDKSNK